MKKSSSSQSVPAAPRPSNASIDQLMAPEDRHQCISRGRGLHFVGLSAVMAPDAEAEDDWSSSGVDNPGYENGHLALGRFDSAAGSDSSTAKRELGQQSELGASNIHEDENKRRRRPGKTAERPGLSRFLSETSDMSNSTTSTFMSWAPSNVEVNERM